MSTINTCPNCGQQTFFQTSTGRACTKCGYKMVTVPHEGKGGKGTKCRNCGKFMVFNEKCRNCGARYGF